jgi:hypothetical protein
MNMMVSATMLASAAAVQPSDAGQSIDAELEALWLEREGLIASVVADLGKLYEAEEKLPEWAQSTTTQTRCEIHEQFRAEANLLHDTEGRGFAAARYKVRMRALLTRQREKQSIEAELGITGLEEKTAAESDRIWDIGSQIMGLTPSINQALAALIVEAGRETLTGCTLNEPTPPFHRVFGVARALRSHSTGAVRASIDRIFSNPDETLENLMVLPS